MTMTLEDRNKSIGHLLNGTYTSLKAIVPIKQELKKPSLLGKSLQLNFGVLIGITGDIKGKIILSADTHIFSSVGEAMFGMPLEGEMLASFSGELGNMIAGSLSTIIADNGIKTDITAPTIMKGDTTLTGYERAIQMTVILENIGELKIYLLLD